MKQTKAQIKLERTHSPLLKNTIIFLVVRGHVKGGFGTKSVAFVLGKIKSELTV